MQEADAVAPGRALGSARDGEGLGPIAAGSDGNDVSVSNGQHVVGSIVGCRTGGARSRGYGP